MKIVPSYALMCIASHGFPETMGNIVRKASSQVVVTTMLKPVQSFPLPLAPLSQKRDMEREICSLH